MADKTQNVKTRLSFDGEAEYKAACKEINSTLKVLNSEMKLVTAEYKDNASSVDALKAKQTVLQKTYDEQAKKVKETEAALQPQIPRETHPAYFQKILIMSTNRNIQPV